MSVQIDTELINKEIELALSGDLNKLWETISSLEGNEEFEKLLNEIKYGKECIFDIRAITEGYYEIKPAFQVIVIERKLEINLTKYREEIDLRKRLMKDILRSLYTNDFDNQEEDKIEGYK